MTFAAEISLGDFTHFHLVGPLGHLEYLVMAPGAFESFSIDVLVVTENHRLGILGCEGQISTADLLTERPKRHHHASDYRRKNQEPLHTPLLILSAILYSVVRL